MVESGYLESSIKDYVDGDGTMEEKIITALEAVIKLTNINKSKQG